MKETRLSPRGVARTLPRSLQPAVHGRDECSPPNGNAARQRSVSVIELVSKGRRLGRAAGKHPGFLKPPEKQRDITMFF
ncbi:hypothetical protein CesoFtcFv8_025235 [Champsocephalus esox]|uniref:Uncharacterized protein n=1 Tax=Champsocephalus esox TaxID=159716 RepID=A0AAN8B437_9TELE|nr:hypothetical protein CesoFtcFv8_025235 [Champsocephalus esox]